MARFSKTQITGFFVTGAIIGAAVALLYAPKTGVQTRKDLRKLSKRTVNRLDDLQDDIRDQVMGVVDNARKVVEDGKSRLHRMIQTA